MTKSFEYPPKNKENVKDSKIIIPEEIGERRTEEEIERNIQRRNLDERKEEIRKKKVRGESLTPLEKVLIGDDVTKDKPKGDPVIIDDNSDNFEENVKDSKIIIPEEIGERRTEEEIERNIQRRNLDERKEEIRKKKVRGESLTPLEKVLIGDDVTKDKPKGDPVIIDDNLAVPSENNKDNPKTNKKEGYNEEEIFAGAGIENSGEKDFESLSKRQKAKIEEVKNYLDKEISLTRKQLSETEKEILSGEEFLSTAKSKMAELKKIQREREITRDDLEKIGIANVIIEHIREDLALNPRLVEEKVEEIKQLTERPSYNLETIEVGTNTKDLTEEADNFGKEERKKIDGLINILNGNISIIESRIERFKDYKEDYIDSEEVLKRRLIELEKIREDESPENFQKREEEINQLRKEVTYKEIREVRYEKEKKEKKEKKDELLEKEIDLKIEELTTLGEVVEKEIKIGGVETLTDPTEIREDQVDSEEGTDFAVSQKFEKLLKKIEEVTGIKESDIKREATRERKQRVEEARNKGRKVWKENEKDKFIKTKIEEEAKKRRENYLLDYYRSIGKEEEFNDLREKGIIDEAYNNKIEELVNGLRRRGQDIDKDSIQIYLNSNQRSIQDIEGILNQKKTLFQKMKSVFSRSEIIISTEEMEKAKEIAERQKAEAERKQEGKWEIMIKSAKNDLKKRVEKRAFNIVKKGKTEGGRKEIGENIRKKKESQEDQERAKLLEESYKSKFIKSESYSDLCNEIEGLYREFKRIIPSVIKEKYPDSSSLVTKITEIITAYAIGDDIKFKSGVDSIPEWAGLREKVGKMPFSK